MATTKPPASRPRPRKRTTRAVAPRTVNPFGAGTREWARKTLAKLGLSTTVYGVGEFLVDDAGHAYVPDGTTQAKNLSPLLTQAAGDAAYGKRLTSVALQNSAYTSAGNEVVPCDATSAGFTVSLPNTPTDGTRVTVKKIDATTHVVTVACQGADVLNKAAGSTSITLSLTNQAITLQYKATDAIWYVVGDDLPLASLFANAAFTGGTLDGVTIGGTASALGVTSKTVKIATSQVFAGAAVPWLNQVNAVSGTLTADGQVNNIAFNDQVVAGSHTLYGLKLVQNLLSPATGPRTGIFGQVKITSAGAGMTAGQAFYVGVAGRAELDANIGGAAGATLGAIWGGWSYSVLSSAATYTAAMIGHEVDMSAASGSSVDDKIGVLIANAGGDAVNGGINNSGLMIGAQSGTTAKWTQGVSFGKAGGSYPWPFNSSSTLIGTLGGAGAALIGLDFSAVTFSGAAILLPGPVGIYTGSGSPEGVVTATPGSEYLNSAGGASVSKYVKESGTGNTGWVAMLSSAAPTPVNATLTGTSTAAVVANSSERFRADGTGLSFNGASTSAKPTITGTRGDGSASKSLLSALATLGLVTDSSTQGSASSVLIVKATTESVLNSGVLQNDDELLAAIAASEVWVYEWHLLVDGSTTGDIRVGVTVPSGATGWVSLIGQALTATIATGAILNQQAAFGAALSAGTIGAGTSLPLIVRALVVNSTNAGNVTLQWSQNAADNVVPSRVLANSYMRGQRQAVGT